MTITTGAATRSYCQTLNAMARRMRDRGWYQVNFPKFLATVPLLVASGINSGDALEIGPGPGYLGLEWLKNTNGTTLTGLDISPNMIEIAKHNAAEYEFPERVRYLLADASDMPFRNNEFDCVFSSASLHEWIQPKQIMNEIARVLKPGGSYYITDLRRSMSRIWKLVVWFLAWPKEVRPYFIASVNESYMIKEVKDILRDTQLCNSSISKALYGLVIKGQIINPCQNIPSVSPMPLLKPQE
jgi:ubiquinone/menaquinone biosynthesis C-methylase UbiE